VTEADAKLVGNERIKLTAGYLNTAATTFFGVGVVAPLVAAIYGFASSGGLLSPLTLVIGFTMFFATSAALHVAARHHLGRVRA
jgi:hypothetical protein